MTRTISITRATIKDVQTLADLGNKTFVESHGHSASESDIWDYVNEKFSLEACESELQEPNNIYHLIYCDGLPVGYSKIVLNYPSLNVHSANVAKLERIYLLSDYHGLGIGEKLFEFNLDLSLNHNQSGMWLFVWTENKRAIHFYTKLGFTIVGSHDFPISKTHSNPNHQMFLKF